jgi:four helix bundle protein
MSTVVREERAKAKSDFASFRDLVAWRKGMDLVHQVYRFTAQLPEQKRFVLAMQMRRAAISVPSNIAEGWGRDTTRDYIRFLHIARGSTYELSTQAEVCHQQGYANGWTEVIADCEGLGRIINGLIKSLRRRVEFKPLPPTR